MIQGNSIMIEDSVVTDHNESLNTSVEEHNFLMQHGSIMLMNLQNHQMQQFNQHHHLLQQPLQNAMQPPLNYQQNVQLSHGNGISIVPNEAVTSGNEEQIGEILNTSEASTIIDPLNENEVPREDAFTYLQGLNSDNLMQFSQQSALQELMNEQMEVKPYLNALPTFEEHDFGGYKFKLNLDTQRKGKLHWIYSSSMKKVYLRMNDILNIEASYVPKNPLQQLRIRVLICFTNDVSEPVLRCQNHLSTDTENLKKVRRSFLRCENPSSQYYGRCDGKSINDRLSVVIPLSNATKPTPNKTKKETIALKFTCQNSCIGRKETSLIFYLENLSGEILSQSVLNVKVCSCPKRDKSLDLKRKMEEDFYPCKKKMKKTHDQLTIVKKEKNGSDTDENSSDSNFHKSYDVQRTPSGHFRIVMKVPTKEIAVHAIECGLNKTVREMFKNPKNSNRFSSHCQKLNKLHDIALKL